MVTVSGSGIRYPLQTMKLRSLFLSHIFITSLSIFYQLFIRPHSQCYPFFFFSLSLSFFSILMISYILKQFSLPFHFSFNHNFISSQNFLLFFFLIFLKFILRFTTIFFICLFFIINFIDPFFGSIESSHKSLTNFFG